MKTQLRYFFVLLGTLLCSVTGYSQINYSQNFNVDEGGWNDDTFWASTTQTCGGMSLRGEFYYVDFGDGDIITDNATTVSPSLGVSNGLPVTLSYNYKLYDYWIEEPLGNYDWGNVTVSWSTSATGPWTAIHTITSANHVTSADCTVKTGTFTPTAGAQVYLRIVGTTSQVNFNDVLFIFDDLTVVQQLPACTGAPAASTAVVLNGPVCAQQNASLALTPAPATSGFTYQWQGSANGTTYTNIPGATATTFSATQAQGPWYRAVVTCTGSGQSTNSTAVQVTFAATNCAPCPVEFINDVEPITQVTFSNLTNTSGNVVNGSPDVENFTALTPANVTTGQAYTFSAQGHTGGNFTTYIKVYIDFNKNGNLNDPGESFQIGGITNSIGTDGITATASIFIPTNALPGITSMRVFKLYNVYASDPCGTGYGYGQVEDYLVNITQCTTVAPTAAATQTVCANATVANLVASGTAIKWYNVASGGAPLVATTPLTNNTTYYASQTNVCEGSARVAVTVNFTVVPVDDPADVTSCGSYILPALTNGVYRTAAGGGGTVLTAGSAVNASATLYVYNTVNGCSAENSFLVTVSNPVAPEPDDVEVCNSYTLPALTAGSYNTLAGGAGQTLTAGTVISETTTLYAFVGTETCFDENSFTITVNNPLADEPDDVVTCTDYVLPELTNGTYHTEPDGLGDTLAAGSSVTTTTTLYVYNAEGTCSVENSFTVTINPYEVDQLDDVVVCSEYALPVLTNGAYFTESGGIGQIFQPGSVITETAVIYVYGVSPDNDACTAETSFTVTVLDVEADEMDDVVTCTNFVLPVLSDGNTYHTQTGGAGTTLPAGSVINQSMTIYVYASESVAALSCTDETSFTVTVSPLETPEDLEIVLEGEAGTDFMLADLEIYTDMQGEVLVYATEADAENGTNPLSPSTVVADGTTYYVTITVGDCTTEPFEVTVDIVLGTENFDMANFSYHPNPVKDVLNLSYSENITGVELYNLVGQKVLSGQYNNNKVEINLSQLASGTYMVKVSTENASKTIKVIRE